MEDRGVGEGLSWTPWLVIYAALLWWINAPRNNGGQGGAQGCMGAMTRCLLPHGVPQTLRSNHSASTRLLSELNKVLLPFISCLLFFSLRSWQETRAQGQTRRLNNNFVTQTEMQWLCSFLLWQVVVKVYEVIWSGVVFCTYMRGVLHIQDCNVSAESCGVWTKYKEKKSTMMN